jgi:hypothetical protein
MSCSQAAIREAVEKERLLMKTAILNSYPTNYIVLVGRLSNCTPVQTDFMIDTGISNRSGTNVKPGLTNHTVTDVRPGVTNLPEPGKRTNITNSAATNNRAEISNSADSNARTGMTNQIDTNSRISQTNQSFLTNSAEVSNLTNTTDLSDFSARPEMDYLDKAVIDTLFSFMKPMKSEKNFVPFEYFTPKMTADISNIISVSNTSFSNYMTNIETNLPQVINYFDSNTNYIIAQDTNDTNILVVYNPFVTNGQVIWISNIYFISNHSMNWIETNTNLVNGICYSNTNQVIVYWSFSNSFSNRFTNSGKDITNILVAKHAMSNGTIIKTNLMILPLSNFYLLIQKEFPEISNTVPYLNIFLVRVTNPGPIKLSNWTSVIDGDYKIEPSMDGPSQINIHIVLKSLYGDSNLSIMTITNQINLSVREDGVYRGIFDLLKPIRCSILNQPTADLVVSSIPEDSSVYLDKQYIGKSPLYYPSVPVGDHVINFLRLGSEQQQVRFQIVENKTNRVHVSLGKISEGGVVRIDSKPTNSSVFIDSFYDGQTPLVLSNLSIGVEHRVKIVSIDTNLKPFYYLFTLPDTNSSLDILGVLKTFEGSTAMEKKLAWLGAYAGWGITIGSLGLSVITHYLSQYYLDQESVKGSVETNASNDAANYTAWSNNSYYAFIFSSILAGTLTANALSKEEIYLGWLPGPDGKSASAQIGIRF